LRRLHQKLRPGTTSINGASGGNSFFGAPTDGQPRRGHRDRHGQEGSSRGLGPLKKRADTRWSLVLPRGKHGDPHLFSFGRGRVHLITGAQACPQKGFVRANPASSVRSGCIHPAAPGRRRLFPPGGRRAIHPKQPSKNAAKARLANSSRHRYCGLSMPAFSFQSPAD